MGAVLVLSKIKMRRAFLTWGVWLTIFIYFGEEPCRFCLPYDLESTMGCRQFRLKSIYAVEEGIILRVSCILFI